jgi:HEPN domain-containing protein
MKNNNDFVKEWFEKADSNILNMKNNLKAEKIPVDTICFHAQQTAEKYIKGYLIYYDIEFKLVHDLPYLVAFAVKIDKKFKDLYEISNKLNDYAIDIRYPHFYTPTPVEAKEAYKITLKAKESVLSRIKIL